MANFLGVSKIQFSALTPEVPGGDSGDWTKKRGDRRHGDSCLCLPDARALQAAGYQCFLAQDAVGSRTDANRDNGLDLIRSCGAVVTNVETLLFDWLKQAGTPVFKQVSKLIK